MHIGINLIALALGYKIFEESTEGRSHLRPLGRLVGIFTMTLALGLTLLTLAKMAAQNPCPFSGKGKCAIMSKWCHR